MDDEAFQQDAFQNDAFQIGLSGTTVADGPCSGTATASDAGCSGTATASDAVNPG